MALMMAVDQLSVMEDLNAYRTRIYRAVSEAMEEAVSEQQDRHHMAEEIAERVNHLNEAVKNLERDLEHKVSLEELSAYLEMPVEEIRIFCACLEMRLRCRDRKVRRNSDTVKDCPSGILMPVG